MKIQCLHCNSTLNVPDRLIGKQGRCPKCATIINVVAEEVENDILPFVKSVIAPEVNKMANSDNPVPQINTIEKPISRTFDARSEVAPRGNQHRDNGDMKKCPYCAEEIRKDAVVCKHCKSDLVGDRKMSEQATPSAGAKYTLYVLSAFIPIVGLVLGIIYLLKPDKKSKKFALTCFFCMFFYIFAGIAFLTVYFGYKHHKDMSMSRRIRDANTEQKLEDQHVKDLEAKKYNLSDQARLKGVARKDLEMIKKDEDHRGEKK